MKNILFVVIFSTFSLYAKNLQPLTHEEVKHFRVLNAPSIRASKGASGYDAIGIFELCRRELSANNTGCACPIGDRIEYFLRLSAAVSLGIGFDAGIINKPMNPAEAGIFREMAKALGSQLQRAVTFVALADVSRGFEHTHLQGFEGALGAGTLRGQHTIDLSGVHAEKSNAALRARLAREYADLPRIQNYDQPFEVNLLIKVIGAAPAYSERLARFLNDTLLATDRLRLSLVTQQFLKLLPTIAVGQITPEDLGDCLDVLRNIDGGRVPMLFSALERIAFFAMMREFVCNAEMVSGVLRKLREMRVDNMVVELDSIARDFPRLSPNRFPDFSRYIATERDPARKTQLRESLRAAVAGDASDQMVEAITMLCGRQNLFSQIPLRFLGRFIAKSIAMVKDAVRPAEKQAIVDSLLRLAGRKILEILPEEYVNPVGMLEGQMRLFAGILGYAETLSDVEAVSAVAADRISPKQRFKNNLSLLLEAPEGEGFDEFTGEPLEADDPLAADRPARLQLIANLSRPSIIKFPDALVRVINRVVEKGNIIDFSISEDKLNGIEALLSLGQDPNDVADMIMQVYELPEARVGREPVARLAERMYDRIIFNDTLPADFRDHGHLNFAVAHLNYPAPEQNAMLEEYVRNHHQVMIEFRRDQARRAGIQIAEVADAGRRVELRTVGCMAVHRIGALICVPLENALNAVLRTRGLRPVEVPAAHTTLGRWIEEYGTVDRVGRAAAAIAHEEEDIRNAKIRYRAVLAKALSGGYAYRTDFDRILSKVVSYINVKDKLARDAWLVNSLGCISSGGMRLKR